jgi:hypothetical protein
MKGVWSVYGTRSCVNAYVRDDQHQSNTQQRCALLDSKTRPAGSTDSTRLSCDSNLRGRRAIDAYSRTIDRHSVRKNAGSERVNLPVKKICAVGLKNCLARLNPTRIERIGRT